MDALQVVLDDAGELALLGSDDVPLLSIVATGAVSARWARPKATLL
jgi:hypothetical protein